MLNLETVAMLYYEGVRTYKQTIGDYSMPKWCEASEQDKNDAKHTAFAIAIEKQPRKSRDEMPEELKNDTEFLVNYSLALGICGAISEYVGVENV